MQPPRAMWTLFCVWILGSLYVRCPCAGGRYQHSDALGDMSNALPRVCALPCAWTPPLGGCATLRAGGSCNDLR